MRKAEIVTITIMSILWICATFIVGQKVYHEVKDGECKEQTIIVPTLLDNQCKPNIMFRKCDISSTPTCGKKR